MSCAHVALVFTEDSDLGFIVVELKDGEIKKVGEKSRSEAAGPRVGGKGLPLQGNVAAMQEYQRASLRV